MGGGAGNQAEEEKDVKGQERWREGSDSGSGEVKWKEEKKDEVTMGREKKEPRRKRKGFYIQQQDVKDTVYGA